MAEEGVGQGKGGKAVEQGGEVGAAKERVEEHHGGED